MHSQNKGGMQLHTDERFNIKIDVMQFDYIMTYNLPFDQFKLYIETERDYEKVYLNLYCLIELYRNKLNMLVAESKRLRKKLVESG